MTTTQSLHSEKELNIACRGGLVVGVAGFLLAMLAGLSRDELAFLRPYFMGINRIGWVFCVAGLFCAGMAWAVRHTHYFDLSYPLNMELAVGFLASWLVAAAIAAAVALQTMPRTPPERLPADPNVRERILRVENGSRLLAGIGIFGFALVMGGYPLARGFGFGQGRRGRDG